MNKNTEVTIIIDGRRYDYLPSKQKTSTKTCEACALRKMCNEMSADTLCGIFHVDHDDTSNFQLAKESSPLPPSEYVTREEFETLRLEWIEWQQKHIIPFSKIKSAGSVEVKITGEDIIGRVIAEKKKNERIKKGESHWDEHPTKEQQAEQDK